MFGMTRSDATIQPRGFGATMRRDAWWLQPLLVSLVSAFVVYSTWAAFQGSTIISGLTFRRFIRLRYLATRRTVGSDRSLVGGRLAAVFAGVSDSVGAGVFRLTCYYYRGAYYKAFWADPPSCAVGEPRKTIPRGAFLSTDHAERASLFPLPRFVVPGLPRV